MVFIRYNFGILFVQLGIFVLFCLFTLFPSCSTGKWSNTDKQTPWMVTNFCPQLCPTSITHSRELSSVKGVRWGGGLAFVGDRTKTRTAAAPLSTLYFLWKTIHGVVMDVYWSASPPCPWLPPQSPNNATKTHWNHSLNTSWESVLYPPLNYARNETILPRYTIRGSPLYHPPNYDPGNRLTAPLVNREYINVLNSIQANSQKASSSFSSPERDFLLKMKQRNTRRPCVQWNIIKFCIYIMWCMAAEHIENKNVLYFCRELYSEWRQYIFLLHFLINLRLERAIFPREEKNLNPDWIFRSVMKGRMVF